MKSSYYPQCAECPVPLRERACTIPGGKAPRGCPTKSKKGLREKAAKEYSRKEVNEFARQASIQEGECYAGREEKPYLMHPVKPRILEVCEFAKRMGYRRLGLVFCGGLTNEAQIVSEIFRTQGFEIVSVMCKVGNVPKEDIGLKENEKIYINEFEAMCNPILQAFVVNDAQVDFNVLLGLCVGHDSLFIKYAEAPVTVLAVKDRVTGHNPLAAVYISGTYCSWLKKPVTPGSRNRVHEKHMMG